MHISGEKKIVILWKQRERAAPSNIGKISSYIHTNRSCEVFPNTGVPRKTMMPT